jgi:hypothetical protein
MQHFRNQVLFPGSHCLSEQLKDRVFIKKNLFLELSKMPETVFQKWTKTTGPGSLLTATIPPHIGSTSLPDRAMLAFEKAAMEGPDTFSANCSIIFFRRGEPTTAEEITLAVLSHVIPDIMPVTEKLHELRVKSIPKELTCELIDSLHVFYKKVDPTLMQPVLKQRVFSLQNNRYVGHICASCGKVNAPHQCPCREGVYYCGKPCQNEHWKEHKRTCSQKK